MLEGVKRRDWETLICSVAGTPGLLTLEVDSFPAFPCKNPLCCLSDDDWPQLGFGRAPCQGTCPGVRVQVHWYSDASLSFNNTPGPTFRPPCDNIG